MCFKQSCSCRQSRQGIRSDTTSAPLPCLFSAQHPFPGPHVVMWPQLTMPCFWLMTRVPPGIHACANPKCRIKAPWTESESNGRWVHVDKGSSFCPPMDDLEILVIQLPEHSCGSQLDNASLYWLALLPHFSPLLPHFSLQQIKSIHTLNHRLCFLGYSVCDKR